MSDDTSTMEEGDSTLAAEGGRISIDMETPSRVTQPLAASTVRQTSNYRPRIVQQNPLDDTCRSSLGILPIGNLQDLSSSLLQWSTNPAKAIRPSDPVSDLSHISEVEPVSLNEDELRQFDEDFSDMDVTDCGSPKDEHGFDGMNQFGTPYPVPPQQASPGRPSLHDELLASVYFRPATSEQLLSPLRFSDVKDSSSVFQTRDDQEVDLSLFPSQKTSIGGFSTSDASLDFSRFSGEEIARIRDSSNQTQSRGSRVQIQANHEMVEDSHSTLQHDHSLFPPSEQSFGTLQDDNLFPMVSGRDSFEGGARQKDSQPLAVVGPPARPSSGGTGFEPDQGLSAFRPYSERQQRQESIGCQKEEKHSLPLKCTGTELTSNNSSEIDSEDEIAAAQQVTELQERGLRQRGVGSGNINTHGLRPGLDGGSSEENDAPRRQHRSFEARQSAEGEVMTSPVLGDGGGGGDGSSGHESDSDRGAVGGVGGGASGPPAGGQTTMDVLRGLGFVGASPGSAARTPYSAFEEDNPEAQQRIRPMGDDLLSGNRPSKHHGHFQSVPRDMRGRTLSGASEEREDSTTSPPTQVPEVQETDQPESSQRQESLLAPQFLLPSSDQFANSQASTTSHCGLDESTFFLADLVQDGAAGSRPGHWPAGDGQDDDVLSDQMLFPDDEPYPVGDAEFSVLQSSGSPISDCTSGAGDRHSSLDNFASFHNQGLKQPQAEHGGKCQFEASTVYLDENGEGVTDLAFKRPLNQELSTSGFGFNPFDSTGDVDLGLGGFGSEEFLSQGEGLALLEQDQQEAEQVITQEDAMKEVDGPPDLSESWDPLRTLDITRPQWMIDSADSDASYLRISMGTFMGSRSAALGSLGNQIPVNQVRPSFGVDKNIVSPPSERQPVALLDTTLVDKSNDEVRGAGVGRDIDLDGDRTLQSDDLDRPQDTDTRSTASTVKSSRWSTPSIYSTAPQSASSRSLLGKAREEDSASPQLPAGPTEKNNLYDNQNDNPAGHEAEVRLSDLYRSVSPYSRESTLYGSPFSTSELSGITNLITTTSTTARPEDLAEMIMRMSTAKLSSRTKQTTQKQMAENIKNVEDSPVESRASQGSPHSTGPAQEPSLWDSVEDKGPPQSTSEPSSARSQPWSGKEKECRETPREDTADQPKRQGSSFGGSAIPENLNNSAGGSGANFTSRIPSRRSNGSDSSFQSEVKRKVPHRVDTKGATKIPVSPKSPGTAGDAKGRVSDNKDQARGSVSDYKDQARGSVSDYKVKDQTRGRVSDHKDQTRGRVSDNKDQTRGRVSDYKDQARGSVSDYKVKDQTRGRVSDYKDQARGRVSNHKDQARGRVSDHKDQTRGRVSDHKDQTRGRVSDHKDQSRGRVPDHKDQTRGRVSDHKDQTRGRVPDHKDQARGRVSDHKDQSRGRVSDHKDQTRSRLSFKDQARGMVTDHKDHAKDRATDHKGQAGSRLSYHKDQVGRRVLDDKDQAMGNMFDHKDQASNRLSDHKNRPDPQDANRSTLSDEKDQAKSKVLDHKDQAENRMLFDPNQGQGRVSNDRMFYCPSVGWLSLDQTEDGSRYSFDPNRTEDSVFDYSDRAGGQLSYNPGESLDRVSSNQDQTRQELSDDEAQDTGRMSKYRNQAGGRWSFDKDQFKTGTSKFKEHKTKTRPFDKDQSRGRMCFDKDQAGARVSKYKDQERVRLSLDKDKSESRTSEYKDGSEGRLPFDKGRAQVQVSYDRDQFRGEQTHGKQQTLVKDAQDKYQTGDAWSRDKDQVREDQPSHNKDQIGDELTNGENQQEPPKGIGRSRSLHEGRGPYSSQNYASTKLKGSGEEKRRDSCRNDKARASYTEDFLREQHARSPIASRPRSLPSPRTSEDGSQYGPSQRLTALTKTQETRGIRPPDRNEQNGANMMDRWLHDLNKESQGEWVPHLDPQAGMVKGQGRQLLQKHDGLVFPQPALQPTAVRVEAPVEVHIPEVCCVGLSAQTTLCLHNPATRWIHVTLSIISLGINKEPCDHERIRPFVIREKVIIEPKTTEEVKVIFSPRMAGVHVAQLNLMTAPVLCDYTTELPRVPTMVTLQAIAEVPDIQVLTEGNRSLDFGILPWGRQKRMRILLINRGRANIPVRLQIVASDKSATHHFTFENHVAPDTSIVSLTRSPPLASLTSTIVNYTLPGAAQSLKLVPVPVYFRTPNSQHSRGGASQLPEEYSASITIEVDTPSSPMVIGTLRVRAAVGTTHLHVPRDMQRVELLSEVGKSESCVIPLRNAGHIPFTVQLEVTHWPDWFKVTPSEVVIQPSSQAEVIVQFAPTQASSDRFESLLLMFVEPGGTGYEIPLLGQVKVPVPRPLNHAPEGHTILANKQFLNWGGVSLGKTVQQNLTVRNGGKETMKLRLVIYKSSSFWLQVYVAGQQRLTNEKELVLQPGEESLVHVFYSPSSVTTDTAKLFIRTTCCTRKFSLRLCGYGGLSSLLLDGVQMSQNNSYWTSVKSQETPGYSIINLSMKNNGPRTAYIRGLCFRGLGCKKEMSESQLTVQPSEFCLRPDQTQPLLVVLIPSERELALCFEESNIIGTVAFFYGEEVSRRKYRRAVVKQGGLGNFSLAENDPLHGVNFDKVYQMEPAADTDTDDQAPEMPNDIELFYSTMRRITLALIGEPPAKSHRESHSKTAFCTPPSKDKTTSHLFSKDSLHSELATCHLKVISDQPPDGVHHHSVTSDVTRGEEWVFKPEQVILTMPDIGNNADVKRVQLINFSDRPLHYVLTWPKAVLIVTPEEGTISPRDTGTICLSSQSMLPSCGTPLPWSGAVHILCDGKHKELQVQIHEEPRDEVLTNASGHSMSQTKPSIQMLTLTPHDGHHHPQPHHAEGVTSTHQALYCPTTVITSLSEMAMDVTNVSPYIVKWYISSSTPPYVKSNGGVCRMTDFAFRLQTQSGLLQPGEKAKIIVSFSPREAGQFSQIWEVRSHAQHSTATHAFKFQLFGQGILQAVPPAAQPRLTGTAKTATLTQLSLKSPRPDASLTNEFIGAQDICQTSATMGMMSGEFRTLAPHTSHVLKVRLKNVDTAKHQLDVVGPEVPFKSRKRTITIKGKHYMHLPIAFEPTREGVYHSTMTLTSEFGSTLTIYLSGQCRT